MTAFGLDEFFALPRLDGLALSPDGRRLVIGVSTAAADGRKFVGSLWEVDPEGQAAPRRLTRSAAGERAPAFAPDGSLLFVSPRPDPDERPGASGDGEPTAALWRLAADGGEAERIAAPKAGVEGFAVARESGDVVFASGAFPGTRTIEEDAERATARREAGVSGQLLDFYPIRWWDHYMPIRERRLFVTAPPAPGAPTPPDDARDVTPVPRRALDDETSFSITPDGRLVLTGWGDEELLRPKVDLVAIDVAGNRRVLATGDGRHDGVAVSPDGRMAVSAFWRWGAVDEPDVVSLWLVDVDAEQPGGRDLTRDFDLRPMAPVWAPDSSAVFFTADDHGHTPLFRVDVATGEITRLTGAGTFTNPCPHPDGERVFALMAAPTSPPKVVVVGARDPDQAARVIPAPGSEFEGPCRVERVSTTAADGTTVESWLTLPPDASADNPAPLLLSIHGGPEASNSGWSWRWNPQVFASHGYAVLGPDPALSTGYGQEFLRRGRGRWGEEPFTDLMACVDAILERPDIDETRTGAGGGSFGGYMANWVAGHTDRFKAIVTHASLWALDQFHGTTDVGTWWEQEFGDIYRDPTRYLENSPNRHVGSIRTPMLVIHGELDHRVPIGEGLRLWTDLRRHDVESLFLYFPDENHWILKPGNSRLWYETFLAWMDHHVLGEEWRAPALV
jgi:dipeptidyl aminopeptidase/acylaminoacyl peptidase